MDKPTSEGICVAIRMRPLNEREINSGQSAVFRCLPQHNAVTQLRSDGQPLDGQIHHYDKVFDENSTTKDVYEYAGTNIVKGVVNGINGTIFAYGQTSSGKTFTMLGGGEKAKGVLDLASTDLFHYMAERNDRDFIVRVSFVEIYNEIIRDLLSDASDNTVAIREDPRKGVYCEATEHVIGDFDGIMKAVQKGCSKRSVESTAMNDTSSRSHTIFKLTVESIESQRNGVERDMAVWVSALNLVDLAGSESVRHTGATGQRAKEGGKINQSLLSLSRVIHALSQPGQHVSFRDSKLTRLLQPSLSGNAKMSIVCCVTAAERYVEETRSTLQFASRAKLVKTNATVNEILDESAKIKRLTKELNELKEKQSAVGLSESERGALEAERNELLKRLESLECEKDEQKAKLERLRGLLFSGVADVPSDEFCQIDDTEVFKKKKRKTKRDTWCPGVGMGDTSFQPTIKSTLSSIKEQSESVQATISKISTHRECSESDTEELHIMIETLKQQNSGLQEEIKSLKGGSSRQNQDHSDTSVELQRVQFLESEVHRLQLALDEKTDEVEDLQEKLDIESSAASETEQEMESQINRLNELLKVSEEANAQLKSELDEANVTLHCNREFDLMEDRAALQEEIKSLKTELDSVSEQLKEKKCSVVELVEAQAKLLETIELMKTDFERKTEEYNAVVLEKVQLAEKLSEFDLDKENIQNNHNDEVQKLQDRLMYMQTEINQRDALNEVTKTDSYKLEQECAELRATVHSLSQQKDVYEEEVAKLNNDIIKIKSELQTLKESAHADQQLIEQYKEQLCDADSVSCDLASAKEELSQYESRVSEYEQTISNLESSIEQYKEQLSDVDSVSCDLASAKEELSQYESRVSEYEQTISNLESSIEQYKEQLSDADSVSCDLASAKEELSQYESRVSEYEQTISNLESSIEQYKEQLSDADSVSCDLASAKEELSQYESRVSEYEQTISNLESSIEQYKEQLSDADSVSCDLASAKEELSQYESRVSEYEQTISNLESSIEQYKEQLSDADSVSCDLASAKEELSQYESRVSEYEQTISNLESSIEQYKEQLSDADSVSCDLASAKEELSQYVSRVSEYEQTISNLESSIEQYKEQLSDTDSVSCDLASAKEELSQYESRVSEYEQTISKLECSIENLNAEVSEKRTMSATIDELYSKLADTEEELCLSRKSAEDAALELSRAQQRIHDISSEHDVLNSDRSEVQVALASAQKKIHDLEDEVCALQESENQLQGSVMGLTESIGGIHLRVANILKSIQGDKFAGADEDISIMHILSMLETCMESLVNESRELHSKVVKSEDNLQSEVCSWSQKFSELECAQEKLTSLTSEVCAELNVESVDDIIMSLKDLQAKLEASQSLSENIEDIQYQLKEATDQKVALLNEISSLQSSLDESLTLQEGALEESASYAAQLNTLENQLSAIKVELTEARQRNEHLSEELDSLKCSQSSNLVDTAELANMTERLELLESCNAEYQETLSMSNILIENLCEVMNVPEATDLVSKWNDFEAKMSQLESKLKESETTVEGLKQTKDILEGTIDELNQQLSLGANQSDAQDKVMQLEDDLSQADDLICELQSKLEGLDSAVAEHSKEIQEKNGIIHELEEELSLLRQTVTSKEHELAQGVPESNASTNENNCRLVELENQLSASENLVKTLEERIREMEFQLELARKESTDTLSNMESSRRSTDRDVEKLMTTLGQKESEISRLMHQIDEWEQRAVRAEQAEKIFMARDSSTCSDADVSVKRIGHLMTQVDLLKGEKESLTLQLANIEKAGSKQESEFLFKEEKMQCEIHKLQELLSKMTESAAGNNAQIAQFNALNSEFHRVSSELSALQSTHKSVINEKNTLEDKLRDLMNQLEVSEHSDLSTEMEAMKSSRNTVTAQLNDLTQDYADVQNRYKRAKDDLTHLHSEYDALTSQLMDAKSENTLLCETVDDLQKRLKELENSKDEAHSTANVTADFENLKSEIASREETIIELKKTIEQLESDLCVAEQQELALEKYKEENESLTDKVDMLQQSLDSVLSSASEERATLTNQIEEVKSLLMEKDKEIQLLSTSANATSSDEYQQLISEMNTLIEQKLDAEAQFGAASSECKTLRDQLSDYDKKSSNELAMLMKAAEEEMDKLKSRYETERNEGYATMQNVRKNLQESKEECCELKAQIEILKQQVDQRSESELISSEEQSVLQRRIDDLTGSNMQLAAELKDMEKQYESYRLEVSETIESKDKRIAHLEKSKLTKDQYEKIKQVREDKNKKTEECKIYKKQLSQLKAAYEDLQQRLTTTTQTRSKSSTVDTSTLQLQLNDVTSQLEQSQLMSSTLKSKLKECSRQLQEYEGEKQAVVNVLKKCGIDVSGLVLTDTSMEESVIEQDLSDSVTALASKWKSAVGTIESLKADQAAMTSEITTIKAEVDSLQAQKLALERRYEATKTSLREANDRCLELNTQLELEHIKVQETEQKLLASDSQLAGSKTAVNVEVQVLEEENIELLKENKELRASVATFKAKAETLSKKLGEDNLCLSECSGSKRLHDDCDEENTTKKFRSDESDIENAHTSPIPSADKDKLNSTCKQSNSVRKFGDALSGNVIDNSASSAPGGAAQGRRGRRNRVKASGSDAPSTDMEQPAECAQS